MPGVPWTPDEDALLRERFQAEGYRAAIAAFPTRTLSSVRARISAKHRDLWAHQHWSEAEDRKFEWLWGGELTLQHIAKKMKRTACACYQHARNLGLPVGVPKGFESFTSAAKRTGYSFDGLQTILEWAHIRPLRTRTIHRGGAFKRYALDPERVDDAIGRWEEREPLKRLMSRLDLTMNWGTAARRLACAGINRPGGKRTHYVTEEQLKDALGRQPLRALIRRLGLKHEPPWFIARLEFLGIPRPSHGRYWWVTEDELRQAEGVRSLSEQMEHMGIAHDRTTVIDRLARIGVKKPTNCAHFWVTEAQVRRAIGAKPIRERHAA